jgi:hypothetical protein
MAAISRGGHQRDHYQLVLRKRSAYGLHPDRTRPGNGACRVVPQPKTASAHEYASDVLTTLQSHLASAAVALSASRPRVSATAGPFWRDPCPSGWDDDTCSSRGDRSAGLVGTRSRTSGATIVARDCCRGADHILTAAHSCSQTRQPARPIINVCETMPGGHVTRAGRAQHHMSPQPREAPEKRTTIRVGESFTSASRLAAWRIHTLTAGGVAYQLHSRPAFESIASGSSTFRDLGLAASARGAAYNLSNICWAVLAVAGPVEAGHPAMFCCVGQGRNRPSS